MLKKSRQKKYFRDEWASMRTQLLAFCETQEPEALHHFRVQVKKIKATLLFLQGRPASKKLKPLQGVFRHAGQIRNAHVYLQLAARYRLSNAAWKTDLERQAAIETRLFRLRRNARVKMLGRLYKTLSSHFQDVENKDVVRFYKKRLKRLARHFASHGLRTTALHQNRKKIKMLLYLHDVLPKKLARELQLNTAYLDELQDVIGQWHDTVLSIDLLKTDTVPDRKMIGKLNGRRGKLFDSIRVLSADFETKAVLTGRR